MISLSSSGHASALRRCWPQVAVVPPWMRNRAEFCERASRLGLRAGARPIPVQRARRRRGQTRPRGLNEMARTNHDAEGCAAPPGAARPSNPLSSSPLLPRGGMVFKVRLRDFEQRLRHLAPRRVGQVRDARARGGARSRGPWSKRDTAPFDHGRAFCLTRSVVTGTRSDPENAAKTPPSALRCAAW